MRVYGQVVTQYSDLDDDHDDDDLHSVIRASFI
jgi:hypothetical protein